MSSFKEAMEGFDWDYEEAAKQFFEDYEGVERASTNLRKRNSQNYHDLLKKCDRVSELEKAVQFREEEVAYLRGRLGIDAYGNPVECIS